MDGPKCMRTFLDVSVNSGRAWSERCVDDKEMVGGKKGEESGGVVTPCEFFSHLSVFHFILFVEIKISLKWLVCEQSIKRVRATPNQIPNGRF